MSVFKSTIMLMLIAALSFGVVAINAQDGATPDVITIEVPGLYPEGIVYDNLNDQFLVTSLTDGGVYTVQPDGTFGTLVEDDQLVSAIGIEIDEANGRVLVCNSDPGASIRTSEATATKLAGLAVYDLATGEEIFYADLGALDPDASHFSNDVAVDDEGNAYVTDSFSPYIYKVDMEGNASVLLTDEAFVGEGFSLNGIVYQDGYLVVAKADTGLLFRIPVDDPTTFEVVEVGTEFLTADGLLWTPEGNLIVVTNDYGIFTLSSDDEWQSATVDAVAASEDVFPTTVTYYNDQLYVLEAQLGVLFDPNSTSPVEAFDIRAVMFEDAE